MFENIRCTGVTGNRTGWLYEAAGGDIVTGVFYVGKRQSHVMTNDGHRVAFLGTAGARSTYSTRPRVA